MNMPGENETDVVYAEVPKETKELAKQKLDHGGITRVVKDALTKVAHGEETTKKRRLQDQLEDLRDERSTLKSDRDDIENDLETVERKIERVERKLDDLRDREGEYEGTLKMIEEEHLDKGAHVDENHGTVEAAATIGDCSEEDVINDLKERNPDLPEWRFKPRDQTGGGTKRATVIDIV